MRLFDPRTFGAAPAGLRRERMLASPRYRDGRFHNTEPLASLTTGRPLSEQLVIVGEFFRGRARRRPPGVIPAERPHASWSRPPETGLRATWLGHSTVLLELDGARVLTDPVFGERASPFSWAGPRRFHRAPASIDELPELDAVIVSHDHYDHLDHESVRALAQRDVTFFTSLGVGAHLESWGVSPRRIVELDWWETARAAGGRLEVTATPARHFSGRGNGSNRTAWSSFVVSSERHQVFFSGDTGLTRELEDIGARFGRFDLVMLEVGAFHPSWGAIHLGPDNALVALRMLGGGALLPVHWATFDLGLHPWDEPAELLFRGAGASGCGGETGDLLLMPRVGTPVEPARPPRVETWWRDVAARVAHEQPDRRRSPEIIARA